jgi:hypothetical protein
MNTGSSYAKELEGSQTSPRRLKLREATSGRPDFTEILMRYDDGGLKLEFF